MFKNKYELRGKYFYEELEEMVEPAWKANKDTAISALACLIIDSKEPLTDVIKTDEGWRKLSNKLYLLALLKFVDPKDIDVNDVTHLKDRLKMKFCRSTLLREKMRSIVLELKDKHKKKPR